MVKMVNKDALILDDKEHFTEYLIRSIGQDTDFGFLVPAISTERVQKIEKSLPYQRKWAGYAVAETMFNFDGHKEKYRMVSQREGETTKDYVYKSFLTLSDKPAEELLGDIYQERWSIILTAVWGLTGLLHLTSM